MLKLLKNLKESWISVVLIIILLIVQAICDLALPDYTSNIVNNGIQNGDIHYIVISGLKMLGITFIIMVCAVLIMLLSARVGAKLALDLREKVFKKVLSFSNKEFREFSTASLITRSTNDIQQIQFLVSRNAFQNIDICTINGNRWIY